MFISNFSVWRLDIRRDFVGKLCGRTKLPCDDGHRRRRLVYTRARKTATDGLAHAVYRYFKRYILGLFFPGLIARRNEYARLLVTRSSTTSAGRVVRERARSTEVGRLYSVRLVVKRSLTSDKQRAPTTRRGARIGSRGTAALRPP